MYEEWKKLVAERAAIPIELNWDADDVRLREVDLLLSDVPEALRVMETCFDDDDVLWLSEILMDVVKRTRDRTFIDMCSRLLDEHPEVTEDYKLRGYVEKAERDLYYYRQSQAEKRRNSPRHAEGSAE